MFRFSLSIFLALFISALAGLLVLSSLAIYILNQKSEESLLKQIHLDFCLKSQRL